MADNRKPTDYPCGFWEGYYRIVAGEPAYVWQAADNGLSMTHWLSILSLVKGEDEYGPGERVVLRHHMLDEYGEESLVRQNPLKYCQEQGWFGDTPDWYSFPSL